MPNWVYNSLTIEGSQELIADVKRMLNRPFTQSHHSWNMEKNEMLLVNTQYSNPIFAFHNIYNHRQEGITDETYTSQPPRTNASLDDMQAWHEEIEELGRTDNSWYNWNVRNWGTKWDVAVHDEEKYPETELVEEDETSLAYRFNTAWSPPVQAIIKLSAQYPDLDFELSYEEEQGWGGLVQFEQGNTNVIEEYDNKCRDCDSNNTMEYCENDCGEICNECNYMGEADLDCVAECDTHKVFLDDEHVPEYRRGRV